MDKKGPYGEVLFNCKKEKNFDICENMGGPRGCYSRWNKSDKKRKTYNFTYMQTLKNITNEQALQKQSHRYK